MLPILKAVKKKNSYVSSCFSRIHQPFIHQPLVSMFSHKKSSCFMSENKNAKCKILTIFHHPHHRRFSMAESLRASNLRSLFDQPGEGGLVCGRLVLLCTNYHSNTILQKNVTSQITSNTQQWISQTTDAHGWLDLVISATGFAAQIPPATALLAYEIATVSAVMGCVPISWARCADAVPVVRSRSGRGGR